MINFFFPFLIVCKMLQSCASRLREYKKNKNKIKSCKEILVLRFDLVKIHY